MPPTVVSLVPSVTELVVDLGRRESLLGRTQFCIAPESLEGTVPAMGGTKNPDVEAIVAARPALVIANYEENRKEDVEALQAAGLEVLVTRPDDLDSTVAMIAEIGERLEATEAATAILDEIAAARAEPSPVQDLPVFVAVWRKPLMGMGGDTYGSDLLAAVGARNVTGDMGRYPELTLDEVAALKPALILLPDEPFRFGEKHVPEFSHIAPTVVVDGQFLWWHGPRLAPALRYFRRILSGHSFPASA